MADARLTKPTVRDQVDHLIGGGLVDKEHLRVTFAPAARKVAIEAKKAEDPKKSNRHIAAELGIDEKTVRNDLSAEKSALTPLDNAEYSAPLDIPLEAPTARGEAEILEQANQIRRGRKESARAGRNAEIAERAALAAQLPPDCQVPGNLIETWCECPSGEILNLMNHL